MAKARTLVAVLVALLMVAPLLATATPAAPLVPAPSPAAGGAAPGKPLPPAAVAAGGGAPLDPVLADRARLSMYLGENAGILTQTYRNGFGVRMSGELAGLLVRLDGASLAWLRGLAEKYGGVVARYWRQIDTALVVLPADPARLERFALEAHARGNAVWLDRVERPAMWDAAWLFNMYNLWEANGLDGTGILVSVIDTGVDPANPAIPEPAYWKDYVNNQSTPYDDIGHGTHVAGIILGRNYTIFDGGAMWHNVLVSSSPVYNPPVHEANLTYRISLPSDATSVTLRFRHIYNLYEKYVSGSYTLYFKMNATVWARFDNSGWTLLKKYTGNQTTPTVEEIPVSVPSGATWIEVSFRVQYYYTPNGTNTYDISDWDITGWFIDNMSLTYSGGLIYSDPVLSPYVIPAEVVNATWWARPEDRFQGMAPNASLAAAKVCGPSGCADSAILDAMNWSLSIGANIVSMSLGGPASSYDPLAQMADYLVEHGVIVVIAAGNEGPRYFNVSSPGISRKAITVAAASKQWTLAYFSSPGPSPLSGSVKPDVAAIGYQAASSIPVDPNVTGIPWAGDFPFAAWAGTSMATPMVSGLAALVLQAHPSWNASLVKDAIIATADWLRPNPFMAYQRDVYKQGAGMIDPHQAVNLTVVPHPANLWIGNYTIGKDGVVTANFTIINNGSTPARVTVAAVDWYWLNTSTPSGGAVNYTSTVESPSVGDTFIVPAGGKTVVTVRINITNTSLPGGYYGGSIILDTNTSGQIKVIMGAKLRGTVLVTGRVYNLTTGAPIAGARVVAYNASNTSQELGNTTTGPDGTYRLYLPGGSAAVFYVEAEASVFPYLSYPVGLPEGGTYRLDVPMAPVPPYPWALVFVDPHANATSVGPAVAAAAEALRGYGLHVLVWNASTMGRPYYPLHIPATAVPASAVIYLAGGTWEPLWDPLDLDSMLYYANNTPGLLVVSSGDLGWFYVDVFNKTKIFENLVHARYLEDMASEADYTTILLNVSTLATSLGLENFLRTLGTPSGQPIGEITVNGMVDYYPDNVTPANYGVAAAGWNIPGLNPATNNSIIYYDPASGGAQQARTWYLAFELEQLDPAVRMSLLRSMLASQFDSDWPGIVNMLRATVNGTLITIHQDLNSTMPAGIYDKALLGVHLEAEAGGSIVYKANLTGLPVTIDLSGLVEPPALVNISLLLVDYAGHQTRVEKALQAKLLPEAEEAETLYIPYARLVMKNITALPGEAWIDVATTSGGVRIQVARLSPAALTGAPKIPSTRPVAVDLYVEPGSAANLSYLNLTIKLPPWADPTRLGELQAYYWNGTAWAPVESISADPASMTATITVNATTRPSLSELGGTPIILYVPTTIVGGELAPSTASAGQGWALAALLLSVLLVVALPAARARLTR